MENLRVSTITSVAELNTPIDLNLLYENIEINDKIKYIEKGDLRKGTPTKKKRISRNPKKKQVSLNKQHFTFVMIKLST